MIETLRTAVVTPLVERWLATSQKSWRSLPIPSGPPSAHAAGPDPDRVLLLGSGISVGYGMATHESALAGHLARQISALTSRGVQLDVLTGDHLSAGPALRELTTSRLRELDVVITTPGALERFLLMPASQWHRQVEEVLDHVAAHAPASLRVLFVGAPEVSKVVRMPWLLGRLADRAARSLNAALEASCARRPYAEFVQFRPRERAGRTGTGRTYQQWAGLIAPSVARSLDAHQKIST